MATNEQSSIVARTNTQGLPCFRVSALLDDSAIAWSMSTKAVAIMLLIPFLVALSGIVAALMGKETYKWFTGEDGFAETIQVIAYIGAFLLSLMVLRQRIRERNGLIIFLHVCLTCGFIFMIGEELSWGQRIVGWETPEVFVESNKQDETNLHNIHGVGSTFKWIQMLVGAYGTVLPLMVLMNRNSQTVKRYRKLISMLIPHYSLIPYFAMLFVWRIYRNVLEPPPRFYFVVSEFNEVMELMLAMGFLLFLVFQVKQIKSEKQSSLLETR